MFSQHGTVESVSLITDRETGRPRGFGFVEMSRADATRAIQSLNGKDMGGRPLRVNEAQERGAGGGGGGGGPRGGGGGGPKRWYSLSNPRCCNRAPSGARFFPIGKNRRDDFCETLR